jgi:amino acid transporter
MMLILLISMAVVLTVYGSFYAQEASPKKEVDDVLQFVKEQEPKEVSDSGLYELRAIQYQQKLILLVIIAASTVLFLFLILLFMKFSKTFTATNIVNGGGLVLVIQAILFVVIASPTTEQLTSAIGALGAIAGYLFGRATTQTAGAAEQQ